ncbi:MAG: beta-Ala-His dipeptidase [Clostridia bacterium]|nr:beta-Ala-His dipeptidase [Clostridia bacterium]
MEYLIKGYEPACLFRFFEEICAIPHGSRNEEKVADYLVEFARVRQLDVYRDEMHNVLIRKPATLGRENEPPVLLQGHTDMVCEKNADVEHDFTRDPLKLALTDDGKVYACGTTLGADDAVAVVIMMSLLDGALDSHPALECLFTTQEEIGMHGADAFDCSLIRARRMINLDSESDNSAIVGCAGGIRSDMTIPVTRVPFAGEAVALKVKGLIGGHSGENIHMGRANANKLMGRLLAQLMRDDRLCLCTLEGGLKDNAIPRECSAVISVPSAANAAKTISAAAEAIRGELVADDDANFDVEIAPVSNPAVMMDEESTRRIVTVLELSHSGVLAMNQAIGIVEFSRNLAVIRTRETDVNIAFSSRSPKESQLDASVLELDTLAAFVGATVTHHSRYPGWDYAPQSPLRDAYVAAYMRLFGEKPIIKSIHAGLEC